MSHAELVASQLSVTEYISLDRLGVLEMHYRNVENVLYILRNLRVHLETPEDEDGQLDDANMRAVMAEVQLDHARKLLDEWATLHKEECRHDHHGNCQEHFFGHLDDCIVVRTRKLLNT